MLIGGKERGLVSHARSKVSPFGIQQWAVQIRCMLHPSRLLHGGPSVEVPELPDGVQYIDAATGRYHTVLLRDDGRSNRMDCRNVSRRKVRAASEL